MYDEVFRYVKELMANNDDVATKIDRFPFRKRTDHIWRVFMWARRLTEEGAFDRPVDMDAVLMAALFHDVGYAASQDGAQHAAESAALFRKYAAGKGYEASAIDFIDYLIRNHSNKHLMDEDGTPLELILLMEADLLDETGALSIVWDCMAEGGQAEQSFEKTYGHIAAYSHRHMLSNPLKTAAAQAFWAEKQRLTADFLCHLSRDLALYVQR